jgi:dolichol-phosphate mannosyltransferase
MRMAFDFAINQGYEGVVIVDGNGKDDISAIPRFIEKLDEGYDHVQGSRYIPGGREENTPFLRKWGVKLLHAPLLSIAARMKCTDTTNGFRAYSKRLLEDSRIQIFRDIFATYELHYYLTIQASRLGFRCTEIPVARTYPKGGKVPTKIK